MVFSKLSDIMYMHAQYFTNHKMSDISIDIAGSYIQMLAAEFGVKMSTFGFKMVIITLIAIL